MTVPAAVTTYRYEGNGVTTVFAYSNRLLTTADVEVKILTRATDAEVETLVLTTDYTVTIVSNSLANITITNPVKIPSGTQDILLSLNLAITQTRSFPRADSLPAADIELGLDKLTLVAQLLNDAQTRSLRFPDSDTNTDGELPPKVDRLGKFLAFGSTNGEPIATEVAVGSTPVTAFGASLVQSVDAAAARTTLGVQIVPYIAASAASASGLEFFEDTDNGTNKITLLGPASIGSNGTVQLPGTGTLATLTGSETFTNKTLDTATVAATQAADNNTTRIATTAFVLAQAASQAEMEAGTSATKYVSPATKQFHPSSPKCWGFVTVSGGTPTLVTSYNITSITDSGVGLLTFTIATDFSSANWCSLGMAEAPSAGNLYGVRAESKAAGSVLLSNVLSGVGYADPVAWNFIGLGDQ